LRCGGAPRKDAELIAAGRPLPVGGGSVRSPAKEQPPGRPCVPVRFSNRPPERRKHLSAPYALRQGARSRPVLLSPVSLSGAVLPPRQELVALPYPPGNERPCPKVGTKRRRGEGLGPRFLSASWRRTGQPPRI